jgi:hypothetical protein
MGEEERPGKERKTWERKKNMGEQERPGKGRKT